MLRIDVVTLLPEMLQAALQAGVTGRALTRKLLQVTCWNPREQTYDRHRTVDDRPFGGGPGMIMKYQPLADTMQRIWHETNSDAQRPLTIYLTPQGRTLDQQAVARMAQLPHLIFIAGRYEGIDERFIEHFVDEEWSIGDYVLSGGELAAAVMIDAMARLQPGALQDNLSAAQDSFSDGLLEFPQYTRPEAVEGASVPEVLLSGHHAAIERWRQMQALGRTWQKRPDLLANYAWTEQTRQLLAEYQQQLL